MTPYFSENPRAVCAHLTVVLARVELRQETCDLTQLVARLEQVKPDLNSMITDQGVVAETEYALGRRLDLER